MLVLEEAIMNVNPRALNIFKPLAWLTESKDSAEQIQSFKDDPKLYDKYCRSVEGELNKRFTLVSTLPFRNQDK